MKVKQKIEAFALNQAMNYIAGNPEKNLPKLYDWLCNIGWGKDMEPVKDGIGAVLADPDNTWYKFIMDLWRDVDNDVLKTMFSNFALNATIVGQQRQIELSKQYSCNIPWAMLIDPTSACNLHCTGCWAAEYGNQLNMSYETLDDIIRQGKELGTYFYLYSGGEPLVRKADIIRLCEAHPDVQFAAFTNGTLIDEAFSDEMLRVKNFIPAISVEGFEEETDFRRGSGTFKKVERTMAILKERHLPFGISCCYTSVNTEVIGSERYFDQMIDWGAKFCWFFTYMPVGKDAVPELMATSKQREFMYHQIRKFRETKPLFTLDFWNDGEYAEGCIAGGRRYLHINANGDMEPCAFIHYSDSSVYEKTILEALQSPLFMAYHNGQPFNENHLRVCPLLDNPDAIVDMVETSGAHSTDLQNPEDVRELADKTRAAAEDWSSVADGLWKCSGKCRNCAAS
jgi:MoaA/NifB/PqqE/SkfB family radical SAM enzyme